MKQININGSYILSAIMISMIILATGVNNEFIKKPDMLTKEDVTEIITEIKDKTQQIMSSAVDQRQETPQFPTSCADALELYNSGSGIYELQLPNSKSETFTVYCLKDTNIGSAWTIIQRRQNSKTDFYRDWREYQNGFGNLKDNYFIGLNIIHLITQAQPHELWIELEDFEGKKVYEKYDSFAIGDEYDLYRLHTLGKFVGTAGDSFTYNKGQNFSTKDYDNVNSRKPSCAVDRHGGWWYTNCTSGNLNGLYLDGGISSSYGIYWRSFRNSFYSLKYAHMAIRPKN